MSVNWVNDLMMWLYKHPNTDPCLPSSVQSACVTRWARYLRPVRPLTSVSVTSTAVSVPASPAWSVRPATAALLIRGTSPAGRAASAATATPSTPSDRPATKWVRPRACLHRFLHEHRSSCSLIMMYSRTESGFSMSHCCQSLHYTMARTVSKQFS